MKRILLTTLFFMSFITYGETKKVYVNLGYAMLGYGYYGGISDSNDITLDSEPLTIDKEQQFIEYLAYGTSIKINLSDSFSLNTYVGLIEANYYFSGELNGFYGIVGIPLVLQMLDPDRIYTPAIGLGYTANIFKNLQLNIFSSNYWGYGEKNTGFYNQTGISLGLGFGRFKG